MLYELALSLLENVDSEIALSFKRDFPEINQLSSVNLKPIVLPIASSVLQVGKTVPSTIDIVQAIQQSYQDQQWRQLYQNFFFQSLDISDGESLPDHLILMSERINWIQ